METPVKPPPANFNKPAYAVFVLAGIYFLFAKDTSQATVFLALALVFDPFDTKTPFNLRPLYQKTWLIVHLVIVFGVFGFMLAGK